MSADRMPVIHTPSPELLIGARAIGDFLFPGDPSGLRRVFYWASEIVEGNPRPPIFRLGGKLAARPAALLDWVAECEAQQQNPVIYPPKPPLTVPADRVLVHNHIKPARRQGTRGFRYWLQSPADDLEICHCGWAAELGEHYRLAAAAAK